MWIQVVRSVFIDLKTVEHLMVTRVLVVVNWLQILMRWWNCGENLLLLFTIVVVVVVVVVVIMQH